MLFRPDVSDDPHVKCVREVARSLGQKMPGIGVGIAGSVATGTHTAESDVDLVASGLDKPGEMQFSTRYRGISVVVVYLPASPSETWIQRWHTSWTDRVALMLRSTVIVRDPASALARLRATVRNVERERSAHPGRVYDYLRHRATSLLATLNKLYAQDRPVGGCLSRLLPLLIDGWCARREMMIARTVRSSGTPVSRSSPFRDVTHDREIIEQMSASAPALHAELRAALPLRRRSVPHVRSACTFVFGEAMTNDVSS